MSAEEQVRFMIGNLVVENIALKAQIAELSKKLTEATAPTHEAETEK